MSRLLLLEDDLSLIDGLKYSLEKNGFELDVARSVTEARKYLSAGHGYDLLLLDVTLPDGTGFMICEERRALNDMTPIIFLTAADEETSIIRGLDCGGDDYITKPFKLGELCSRIRALLRRSALQSSPYTGVIRSGPVTIDQTAAKAYLSGEYLDLTGAEYRLLCLFIRHAGQTLTRNLILDELWDGQGNFVDDNTLSVNVNRLRKKLEASGLENFIGTKFGVGYFIQEEEADGK